MEIWIFVCLLLCCSFGHSEGTGPCSATATRQCLGDRNYCGSLSAGTELSCEEGQCRCPDNQFYDYCTCLPHIGSCLIEKDSGTSVGGPSTRGDPETTYSCVATDNCNYDVHVIGNYESSNGRHGFGVQRVAGDTNVQLRVSGQSSRPLILVLVSYEPVRWRLSITGAAVIDRVILSGYYSSTITTTSGGVVREIERLTERLYGHGTDIGGGDTAELLDYLQQRFGAVSSFSGSYRADRWQLTVDRTTECSFNNATRSCSEPPPPVNGRVNISGVQPIVATYSCDIGTLLGTDRRLCQENNSWSGEEPTCVVGNVCTAPAIRQCLRPQSYCGSLTAPATEGSYAAHYELSCEEDQCRCPGNEFYDYCTCLPHVGSCLIEKDSDSRVGTPSSNGGGPETTYSCVAFDNCNYDVHVIGNYESSDGRHGFGVQRVAGDTDIQLSVRGQSSHPLILVLASYEPVRWRLRITGSAVIDRVLVSSYYNSTVSSSSSGAIREIETLSRSDSIRGYGSDIGGGRTVGLLLYLQQRFGPISSFSGSYRADHWELNIQRNTGCTWENSNCPELPSPINGRVDISSLQPVTRVRYSCDVGFVLSSDEIRTCLPTRQWSGESPTCLVQSCPSLSPPTNGEVSVDETNDPSVAAYSCNTGFQLIGQSERTCLPTGQWSAESPICHRVSCPPLPSPLNGRVTVNDNGASYTCNVGFYATGGDRTRNCLATGEWSGQPPICVRVQCQILRAPLGGQVFVNSYAYLATARYSCDAGRTLVGPETRKCEADGFWSGYAPSCEVDDECSGYRCSSGQCVVQRADCSSQDTSSDNSDRTPNGVAIGVPLTVAILVVIGVVLLMFGICFRLERLRRLRQSQSTSQESHTSVETSPAAGDLHFSVSDPQKTSELTALSDNPPQYSQAAIFSSVDQPPPYTENDS